MNYPPDIQSAVDKWNANCGPASLAALLERPLASAVSLLDGSEARGYMTVTAVTKALTGARVTFKPRLKTRPACGLVFIQWGGHEKKPPAVQYKFTHWIAVAGETVFELNAPRLLSWDEWQRQIPAMAKEAGRGDGTFSIQSAIALYRNGSPDEMPPTTRGRPRKITRGAVTTLLETTDKPLTEIADHLRCSRESIRRMAVKELGIDVDARADRHGHLRPPNDKDKLGLTSRFPGVSCPKCKSLFILKRGKARRYGSQRYRCGACHHNFQTEYKWITSGDRAKHMAKIVRCSGYTRSDTSDRWEQYRIQRGRWPYLKKYERDEAYQLLKLVYQSIPYAVPEQTRDDICQDAVLAILAGDAQRKPANVRAFVTKWWQDAHQLLTLVSQSIPCAIPDQIRDDICEDTLLAILAGDVQRKPASIRGFVIKWRKNNSTGDPAAVPGLVLNR